MVIIPHYILHASLEHICRGTGAPLKAHTPFSCLSACFLSHPCVHAEENLKKNLPSLNNVYDYTLVSKFYWKVF